MRRTNGHTANGATTYGVTTTPPPEKDLSPYAPIGWRVTYYRLKRRLSRQGLADRLGRSKSWLEKVEQGVRRLDRLSVIEELAAALEVPTVRLLALHDPKVDPSRLERAIALLTGRAAAGMPPADQIMCASVATALAALLHAVANDQTAVPGAAYNLADTLTTIYDTLGGDGGGEP